MTYSRATAHLSRSMSSGSSPPFGIFESPSFFGIRVKWKPRCLWGWRGGQRSLVLKPPLPPAPHFPLLNGLQVTDPSHFWMRHLGPSRLTRVPNLIPRSHPLGLPPKKHVPLVFHNKRNQPTTTNPRAIRNSILASQCTLHAWANPAARRRSPRALHEVAQTPQSVHSFVPKFGLSAILSRELTHSAVRRRRTTPGPPRSPPERPRRPQGIRF